VLRPVFYFHLPLTHAIVLSASLSMAVIVIALIVSADCAAEN
jgi:hypothetical protein